MKCIIDLCFQIYLNSLVGFLVNNINTALYTIQREMKAAV